ncbi:hypothetical protein [Nostoc paludosum]|uniref:hypothetical protein n=1 Tax=Nostoc paludosum TaxID=212362 RepID=UPI001685125F|nr:hypothetical protein [Nostoc paludosum]
MVKRLLYLLCIVNGALGIGHGAWGIGHGAWGIGHGAWGMGGIILDFLVNSQRSTVNTPNALY